MAYCTIDNIKALMDEADLILATDDDDLGVINVENANTAITDADGEINGYLGSRYPVPLDPVPPIIKKFSVDIAIYNIYSRRIGSPESREKRYNAAVRYLEKVAKGDISLGKDDPDGSPNGSDTPVISNETRIFSRTKMGGF